MAAEVQPDGLGLEDLVLGLMLCALYSVLSGE